MQESMEKRQLPIQPRYYGKYRGLVTSNLDPKNLGRVRARVPEVLGELETGWAIPCTPYAGDNCGAYMVPKPGTGVWMEFESGDISRPIWSGCWWGDNQLPMNYDGAMASPSIKTIRSEKGLMLTLDDDKRTIHVSDENGQNMLEIKVQSGTITIKGAIKAIVEAPQIELAENASHPAVLGDELLQYLNQLAALYQSHVHPGQVAGTVPVTPTPPVPSLPPAGPTMLSARVKIE
jgi:uncharacterized protein involved in type VI secretion and phage assembly